MDFNVHVNCKTDSTIKHKAYIRHLVFSLEMVKFKCSPANREKDCRLP